MISFVARLLIVAGSFFLASHVVPGIHVDSFYTAIILALVWGFLTFVVRPILTVLTLPITILTLGLFSLVLNVLLFWFMSTFVKGFSVDGFVAAILGVVVVSVGTYIAHKVD